GNERDTTRGRAPDHLRRLVGEVDTVDDDLDDHILACERCADEPRVAMTQGPHGVEEMRHGSDAAIERGVGLVGGGVRVPAGDGDPAQLQEVDQLLRAGQLRRERDQSHRPGADQTLEQRGVRIAAPEAVRLEVDEAGRGDPASVPRGEAVAGDRAVGDLDVAGDKAAIDERGRDAEPHRSASRTLPAARSSRSVAEEASMPASKETIAIFALPPAAASAPSTSSSEAPVASSTARRARVRSFSFVAATSIIRSPKVLPSRIIARVEIVFRTSFCAVPAFRRVEPATNSGPTTTASSCSQVRASSESRTETTQAVRAPAAAAASSAPIT